MADLLPPADETLLACAELDDGRHACLMPMTFGKVRLVVSGSREHQTYDDGW